MFLSFLQKWSFNLCLKLLSEFANFSSVGKFQEFFQNVSGILQQKYFDDFGTTTSCFINCYKIYIY